MLKKKGFTLMEVLIALALVGVLSAVAIGVFKQRDNTTEYTSMRDKAVMNMQGVVKEGMVLDRTDSLDDHVAAWNRVVDKLGMVPLPDGSHATRDGVVFSATANTDPEKSGYIAKVEMDVNGDKLPNMDDIDKYTYYLDRWGNLVPSALADKGSSSPSGDGGNGNGGDGGDDECGNNPLCKLWKCDDVNKERIGGFCRCKSGYEDNGNGVCIIKCEPGYVYNETTSKCELKCNNECTGGKVPNSDTCECECSAGQEDVNGVCMTPCAAGQTRDDNCGCVTPCPSGQTRNADCECVEIGCPQGQIKEGNCGCVEPCPAGTERDSSTCGCVAVQPQCEGDLKPDGNGGCACEAGLEQVGTQCKTPCAANQYRNAKGDCITCTLPMVVNSSKNGCSCAKGYTQCPGTGECVKSCKSGYERDAKDCQCKILCGANQKRVDNDNCECMDGYLWKGSSCEPDGNKCPTGYAENAITGECEPIKLKPTCETGYVYNEATKLCELKAPNASPQCKDWEELVNGVCLDKCPGSQVRNSAGNCVCPEGYDTWKGIQCLPSCGNNAMGRTEDGACTCRGGYYWNGSYCAIDNGSKTNPTKCSFGYTYNPITAQCVKNNGGSGGGGANKGTVEHKVQTHNTIDDATLQTSPRQ